MLMTTKATRSTPARSVLREAGAALLSRSSFARNSTGADERLKGIAVSTGSFRPRERPIM
jgi:hypothetical protein